MAAVLAFMEDPLVAWVRTFSAGDPVDFEELSDGVYLHDVLLQIDQRGLNCDVNRTAKDTNARIQNWTLLIARLKSFYQDVLRATIVMEMPNILGVVKESTKESSLADLKNVLLLLLGCAVQCDQKEEYVSKITELDIKTQQAMVVHIKEVTEDTRRVMPLELSEWDKTHRSLSAITRTIAQQRDKHAEGLVALTLERDYYQAEVEKKGPLTPPAHLEKYHLVKELNITKGQLKTANHDLDEKARIISELKDEVSENKATITKLRTQNFDLQRTARSVQTYRDEVDSLKERAVKAEKLEKDNAKYKEKINELDFYKSRVEEVREDNAALSDAKIKLEDQLATANKRIDAIMDELVTYQIQCEESQSEKEKLQRKLQELADENAALEFDHSNMMEGLPGMRRMRSTASLTSSQLSLINGPYHKSISDELKDSVTSHLTKMEQDNEELRQQLEENKQKSATAQREFDKAKAKLEHDYERRVADLEQQTRELRNTKTKELTKEYEDRIMALEKQQMDAKRRVNPEYRQRMFGLEQECSSLKQRVSQLQDKWSKDKEQKELLEKKNNDLSEEKEEFKKTLRSLQESSDDKIKLLEGCRPRSVEVSTQSEEEERSSSSFVDYLNRDNARHLRPERQESPPPPTIPRTPSQQSLSSSRAYHQASTNEAQICDIFVTPSVTSGSSTSFNRSSGVSMRNKPAARGVVTPQRRSVPNNGYISYTQPKDYHKMREDKNYYHSSTSTPMRPRSEVQPFSRSNPLRQSMPERLPERIVYVSPEKQRPAKPLGGGGGRHHQSTDFLKTGSGLNKEKSRSRESFTEKLFGRFNFKSSKNDTDRDSGHATSPESPNLDDSRDHRQSLSIFSSETVRTSTQVTTNTSSSANEKYKIFVDKIVDLQDRNQALIIENTELKRALSGLQYAADRLDKLEDRNFHLEVENRKLKKIIETLQGSGRNPHDNRIYHYYSNV